MIYSSIKDAASYLGISEELDIALRHLTPDFLSSLTEEVTELLPGRVWCSSIKYETVSEGTEGVFEAHREFLDIHLTLEGHEVIELAPPLDLRPLSADGDLYLYRGRCKTRITLAPGDFLVTFPEDAHRLRLAAQRKENVTKVVFKVKHHI